MYAIMIDYYHLVIDHEKEFMYTVPCYLGVDEKHIFIWEEMITSNTRRFETARACGEYLDTYFKDEDESYGRNLRIVKLYKEI